MLDRVINRYFFRIFFGEFNVKGNQDPRLHIVS